MWYVGLDVHRDTLAISVRNARGVIVNRRVVPTVRAAVKRAFADFPGKARIACESGPLASWVRGTIETRFREVIVCDRRRTRLSTSGAKTDRIDADKLSELLWKNTIHHVYLPRAESSVLRRFAAHYARMVRDRSRVLHRLQALFAEAGIQIKTRGTKWGRPPVHRLRDRGSRQVARAYLQQLETATKLVSDARLQLVQSAQLRPAFELLQTIPYIGEIRAAELIAVIDEPERFRSLRRFWAYGGLAVLQRVSAEHRVENGRAVREEQRRGIRLSPSGQPMLKKVLRDVALHASLGGGVLRTVYDGHIARGKAPAIARLALARKIAAIILAVWRSGQSFDPAVISKTNIRGEHQEGSLAVS